eukprot:TRINITY_DN7924_c0_g1_i1.p1 TRINITY_DN7924_c0_g1~~TRINITY_DN7924_c0_g1_i1.p1  ORF type:complete len:198 (+),score=48.53 TRINITY_DN7924_c0_g1_i1:141-734(+)
MDAALKEVSSLFGHFKGTPMDAKLKEVNSLFGQFKASYAKNDSPRCLQILSQLKLKLTEFPSLPPLYQQSPTAQQELILAREIFEHAVVLSVRMEDKDAFERNFLQLKAYYTDTRQEIAGCSEKSYESLTFPEAQKILMVKSVAELEEYAAEHEWDLRDGQVFFQKVTKEPSACREIPSMSLVKQNLGYARELERIV